MTWTASSIVVSVLDHARKSSLSSRRSKSHIDKRLDAATGNAFLGKQVLTRLASWGHRPPRRSPARRRSVLRYRDLETVAAPTS